jgi:hypothetical protein
MRQGFSLVESIAICETRGILLAKWQDNHIKIITNGWLPLAAQGRLRAQAGRTVQPRRTGEDGC